MGNLRLLVVDDDPLVGGALVDVLEGAGYRSRLVETGGKALEAIAEESFDLVVQDVRLPDADGLDILREILSRQPQCGAVVMTGYGTIDCAVRAMKLGAFDFLTKPFPMEMLLTKVESFLEFKLKRKPKETADPIEGTCPFSKIITRSPSLLATLRVAAKVAATSSSVLIQGESGTGKELVAEAIHGTSERRGEPFIRVNCAAIPSTLVESEMFGVEKGAFTGAEKSRPGYIEMASGGTLFLDEIGELPLEVQGKLLRALEEKGVARVGGTGFKRVDFRLICATNRNLADMVKRNEFRKDLFFRINVVLLNLAPLRERREDIPLLLTHFIGEFCPDSTDRPEFVPEVQEFLSHYPYPGNIRELRNLLEMLSLLHPGEKIHMHHLPQGLQQPGSIADLYEVFSVGKPLKDAVSEFEKRYIEKVVDYSGGRKTEAARILGLTRKTLWEKLKK